MTSVTAVHSGREMTGAAIEAKGVSRYFGDGRIHALDHIDLHVRQGEFVSLVGPSGCGKTTLLRAMAGLIGIDEGELLVGGEKPHPGLDVGFVFQQARLMPWKTVEANVAFPLVLQGVKAQERFARTRDILATVGLADFAKAYPHALSGGMQQRVGLARALVGQPSVLLMDEPFAALDAMTREFMRGELLRIWSQRRASVVFVTHDIDEAIFLSNRIVLLAPRPGRVDRVLDVKLPEPRDALNVHTTEEFVALRTELWGRIREMVAASREWNPDQSMLNVDQTSGSRTRWRRNG